VSASLITTHILLSRLAYLDAAQALAWSLLLLGFIMVREKQDMRSITLVYLASILSIFTKTQGLLFPLLLLCGRVLEQRGRVLRDPITWALLLSLISFGPYILSHPETFAILTIYTGKVIGFIDLPKRLTDLLTLWRGSLGIFLLLIPMSLLTVRKLPWSVLTLLGITIGINFFLSPRLYYSTYLVFFALPIGLLLSHWSRSWRWISLAAMGITTLLVTGPTGLIPPTFRPFPFRESGYWNTHAAAINASIGDVESVIALGHVGHQVRWYVGARVLVGNDMDLKGVRGTFLVIDPSGTITVPRATLVYRDERVGILRR